MRQAGGCRCRAIRPRLRRLRSAGCAREERWPVRTVCRERRRGCRTPLSGHQGGAAPQGAGRPPRRTPRWRRRTRTARARPPHRTGSMARRTPAAADRQPSPLRPPLVVRGARAARRGVYGCRDSPAVRWRLRSLPVATRVPGPPPLARCPDRSAGEGPRRAIQRCHRVPCEDEPRLSRPRGTGTVSSKPASPDQPAPMRRIGQPGRGTLPVQTWHAAWPSPSRRNGRVDGLLFRHK
jgi:hypothetical protein